MNRDACNRASNAVVSFGDSLSLSLFISIYLSRTPVYMAVRSDDRNDSNHRLTSGIRYSGFRVATPEAIVAVYDCRARSSSSFTLFPTNDSSSLLSLLLFFLFLSFYLVFFPTCRLDCFVSLRLFSIRPFPFPCNLSLRLSLSLSLFLSLPFLSIPLNHSPRISFSFPLSRSRSYISFLFLSFARFWSLPTSRWSALDPTRYRPHSRAQRRGKDIYVYAFACAPFAVATPPSCCCSCEAARSIVVLLKSHNFTIFLIYFALLSHNARLPVDR